MIKIYYKHKGKLLEDLEQVVREYFNLSEKQGETLLGKVFPRYFSNIKENLFYIVETEYIDKFYRDTYYNYYSTKLKLLPRNCIRVSFFEEKISPEDFNSPEGRKKIKKGYLGFVVIRPTFPQVVGRSALSPKCFNVNNISICQSVISSSINGLKVKVKAFPHSSQDSQIITCAETSLWAIMEYFGNRYAEYKPILPSALIQDLNSVTNERQIPSKGLMIHQLSFVLRKYGFGTVVYSRKMYKDSDFRRIVYTYIDSGLPFIAGISNASKTIGHALVCVGQEIISDKNFDEVHLKAFTDEGLGNSSKKKNIKFYDFSEVERELVVVDDNFGAYQRTNIDNTTDYYLSDEWKGTKIDYIVVPLYPKIYLEAFEARKLIYEILIRSGFGVQDGSSMNVKIFMASSRSYKNDMVDNDTISLPLRKLILSKIMPKFVWVAETSLKGSSQDLITGLVILDSTEPNTTGYLPLILALINSKFIDFDENTGKMNENFVHLHPFKRFLNNQKSYKP